MSHEENDHEQEQDWFAIKMAGELKESRIAKRFSGYHKALQEESPTEGFAYKLQGDDQLKKLKEYMGDHFFLAESLIKISDPEYDDPEDDVDFAYFFMWAGSEESGDGGRRCCRT
ncbi:hypothetical protein TWF694_008923 [Orbilia ellipsospora]|uniref:Uncharacterized protein n=1 Tax=Orbilia ellipsospora TaxID=2528407 RepID=A0AAV9XJT8_9PEZI